MMKSLDPKLLQAFVLLVETGSVSETARKVGRTQPAVTLQIQRLESSVGTKLFSTIGRRFVLTSEGELLLGYARTILQLQNEVHVRLSAPKLDGQVILGVPDLYAAALLPQILSSFFTAYPNVEIILQSRLSSPLVAQVTQNEIDLALVTGMRAFPNGQVVADEPLVWVTSEMTSSLNVETVPLAMLPIGNVFRDIALDALQAIGRKWKIQLVSEGMAGLQAAVMSGSLVTVIAKSAVVPGMRVLGKADSFPTLSSVQLVLYQASARSNPAAEALADVIRVHFASSGSLIKIDKTQAGSGSF
ncbi:LysR substrate-binding domain-containing protein [Cohaesibacter celericrescens]|uniref:LysR family transcriptional regulator n=1 Tax=Cohaesibacter celericrescens TaxID=2067669 RepID=A0A2N5XRP5_9HYPH|nr:LysR substrate-binding domain-containing protein [Cohaesibacter celericrescens]PLW77135.1 LysR family transcriptional regulator [Cohaesibacter celericrescens]